MDDLIFKLIILFLVAFVPSVVYTIWIRNTEVYSREPWTRVFYVFMWGAVFAIIISIFLELVAMYLYGGYLVREYGVLGESRSIETLFLACIVAPFVEEAAKAVGVWKVRGRMYEVEDGIVYGAAAGLGFAATENLFYEAFAWQESLMAFVVLAVIRSVSSSLLHASATGVTGYGIAQKERGYAMSFIPYYLLAVLMHGLFNLLASLSLFMDGLPILGLLLVTGFSWFSIRKLRDRIRYLDRPY